MQAAEPTFADLGNDPPLVADGRAGPPDRRDISVRWLSGACLTGITSVVLLGVALLAALDGREPLATPPEIADFSKMGRTNAGGESAKAERVVSPRQIARAKDRRRMEISTVSRVGDHDVIRTQPFVQIKIALAAGHKSVRNYPAFDPLEVFAEDGAVQTATTELIYGAKVESEMSLRTVDFPLETAAFDEESDLSADEVEAVVRTTGAILTDGSVQVAALHYLDPQRFGESLANQVLSASYGVRIVPENVSVWPRAGGAEDVVYAEEIIPFNAERSILEALTASGYDGDDATGMAKAISGLLNASSLKAGTVLRVGLEVRGERPTLQRVSVYDRTSHLVTIARNDRGQYAPGAEPEPNPALLTAFDDTPPVVVRGNLPTFYDGIYRAAYAYGMSRAMTKQLIKLLAADVDFQSRVGPADRLEVFFSQPDDDDQMSEDSELLYVSALIGGNLRTFYRFAMADGVVDYFDADGRSADQFLLRNPVPNGKFRSNFGPRRHPILGYVKMHTGVDWSAPRGTPIIASGNGVVEEAGWAGGYGRQTIIRHANGYQTSYSHQSAIARGVREGARVRQGQVIGHVGSTGLATGDHLHYELSVNGRKVDPMRVRLPVGRVLKDAELEAFERERQRIDDLLKPDPSGLLTLAGATAGG